VAFSTVHQSEHTTAGDIHAVQRLVREVGHALDELAKTLDDGIVETHELDRTIPELDDVIRECARLKHWLQHRRDSDAKRRQKEKLS